VSGRERSETNVARKSEADFIMWNRIKELAEKSNIGDCGRIIRVQDVPRSVVLMRRSPPGGTRCRHS